MLKLIAGIDEAGRGPIIGPLVLAGILIEEKRIKDLVKMGVKDSKKLSPKKRENLSQLIKNTVVRQLHVEISPKEIDNRFKRGVTLNQLEAEKIVFIIKKLNPNMVYVDCPDTNPARFTKLLRNQVKSKKVRIIAMHYADENIPVVAAASIVAKVRRDQLVKQLAEQYGEIGSGYTSDQRTRLFIENIFKRKDKSTRMPRFIRSTWKTMERLRK